MLCLPDIGLLDGLRRRSRRPLGNSYFPNCSEVRRVPRAPRGRHTASGGSGGVTIPWHTWQNSCRDTKESSMDRRDFLRIAGGVAFVPHVAHAAEADPTTVLFDDQAVTLRSVGKDPGKRGGVLWVRKADLPRINGFEMKPQGA